MGTTPTFALPYPAPADPADVPTDLQELAERVEDAIGEPLDARLDALEGRTRVYAGSATGTTDAFGSLVVNPGVPAGKTIHSVIGMNGDVGLVGGVGIMIGCYAGATPTQTDLPGDPALRRELRRPAPDQLDCRCRRLEVSARRRRRRSGRRGSGRLRPCSSLQRAARSCSSRTRGSFTERGAAAGGRTRARG